MLKQRTPEPESIEAALSGEAVFNDSLLSDAKTLIAKVEGRS